MPSGRIPSLDGLRAVSICAVLFGHLCGTAGFPLPQVANITGDLGNLGVRIFFVISGFLITGLLLKEYARYGRISLTGFYGRRTMRIFPAAFAFIGIAAVLFPLKPWDLLHAVTYTSNYHAIHGWTFAHLWSLSVEEQFYLLWPAVMVILGVRRAPWAVGFAIVMAPVFRTVGYFALHLPQEAVASEFQCTMDAIAVGCLMALLRARLSESTKYTTILRSRWVLLLVPAVLVFNLGGLYPRLWLPLGQTVINVTIALLIDRFVRFPGPVFNHPVLVWIGVRSYSLYLWQQVFLNRNELAWYTAFPANIALAVVAAMLSYACIEKPFLALRKAMEERNRDAGARAQVETA